MFNSYEDYVMDFEADEKRAHLSAFDAEDIDSDISTITATEVDSCDRNASTPTLFFKLKKFRILMKKLPQSVLSKYNLNGPSLKPLRSSKRIKGKNIPIGKFLSMHKNKSLNEIINKQKKNTIVSIRAVKLNKSDDQKNLPRNKKLFISCDESNSSFRKPLTVNNSSGSSFIKQKSVAVKRIDKIIPSCQNDKNCNVNSLTDSPDGHFTNSHSLHERIAATRAINKPVVSTLPNFRNINRYDIPPNSRNGFVYYPPREESTELPNMGNNWLQNYKIISRQNTNLQNTSSFGTTFTKPFCNKNTQSPNVYPTLITTALSNNLSPHHSINSNNTATPSSTGSHRLCHSTPRKFTVQAFKIPYNLSNTNSPVEIGSPKVLVINNPPINSHPLNISSSKGNNKRTTEKEVGKKYSANNDIPICVESDSESQQSDTEEQTEPEVIKRIIYHTKSVQTKFTCNSSICGLVDTSEFNLNCFYCYDIFPLHKWFEFKEHVKLVHHVEEKASLSDSDEDYDNSCQNIKVAKNLNTNSKSTNGKKVVLNKENLKTNKINTTEKVFKKLPLEPRLVTQGPNKMTAEPAKLLSSTLKTISLPSEHLNRKQLSNNYKNNCNDEIINLDNDECNFNIRNLQADKTIAIQKPPLNNAVQQCKNVKLVLPSLPQITIKKVERPKNAINSSSTPLESLPSKESFIKIPSNYNIQKVIKTIPKQTSQEPSATSNTKPRYFIVKKVIKLPTDKEPDMNIPKGMILTKMQQTKMNGENSVPKPTSGSGILFGVTNSGVVIEFLLKLKTFPELWSCQLNNNNSSDYNECIKKLCDHLNTRFDLNMTESEMRLSVQRVKDWYKLMVKSIHEHNKIFSNSLPYKHRFPIYFKILNQFLPSDVPDENSNVNTTQLKINTSINETRPITTAIDPKIPATEESKTKTPVDHFKSPLTKTINTIGIATIPDVVPTLDNPLTPEVTAENLIEFDADTLYDQESSEEEDIEELDEASIFFKELRRLYKTNGELKSRTKVYIGSYECDICRKVFKRACDLNRHKVLHFPPQFECGRCSQKFYYKHSAKKCTHLTKRSSKYQRVDKSSNEKRIWPKKIFRFKMICEICGAAYRSIGSLNTHRKDKHFNQRHKCVVCNFTALSNWLVVKHQRKRHIVEPGTVEEVAKKSRARTDTKTPFSNEARQEFDWRREMRKKVKPGEKFFGCCKCRIIFNSRKEKVLHNKIEHPITEYTVLCLLCLPNKLILANSNTARRHYTDIHKVPWDEIDGLVKATKPIFNLLSGEEIELLKASENYKELLDELLKDKKLQPFKGIQTLEDEASKAVDSLPTLPNIKEKISKIANNSTQVENVYVDGIVDHDYSENDFKDSEYANINEHNYSEDQGNNDNFNDFDVVMDNQCEDEFYGQESYDDEIVGLNSENEINDTTIQNYNQINQEFEQSIVVDFVDGELVEESLVVEEYIDEVIVKEDHEYI